MTGLEVVVLGLEILLDFLMADLAAWAAQVSLEFGAKIEQAARWHAVIQVQDLSPAMQARSMRLMAILRATFMAYPRSMMLISGYLEGVSIQGSVGVELLSNAHGFELLRQLTLEYSLRTRNEALVLRTMLANKTFVLANNETSPQSVVSDIVRKLDLEAARYQRFVSKLPQGIDRNQV